MKNKKILSLVITLSMVMSSAFSVCVRAEGSGIQENYTVENPESAISVIAEDALTLKNGSMENVTATGMTKGKAYDSEKDKLVTKLAFNAKAEGIDVGTAPDVVAGLEGLAALLKDGVANTVSFDYKIVGASSGNVGIFFSDDIADYSVNDRSVGILLGNKAGINARATTPTNRKSDSWNEYAKNVSKYRRQQDSDNRQWNRLTLSFDDTGKHITTVYLNGKVVVDNITNPYSSIKNEINTILFTTAHEVSATKDLAVLMDNFKVYEGTPKFVDTSVFTSEFNLLNDTTNTGFKNMTESYIQDPVKGVVRQLTFNKKADGNTVRSGLSGFAKYMTDETVNTISFDYKLGGSSANAVGFFLGDYKGAEYWTLSYASMLLGNGNGISLNVKANNNSGDYDAVAQSSSAWQAKTNNREWNRVVLEVYSDGVVKGYVNGEYFGEVLGTNALVSPVGMDNIFFNTKPLVGEGGTDPAGSLSILLDDISVYPGAAKAEEFPTPEEQDFMLVNSQTVNGTTVTGVRESKHYDEVKDKIVRRFDFDAKAEGANTAGSTDVRAVLSGFAKYMTDEDINTISFDYKLAGSSDAHIGLFLVNGAEDFGEQVDPGVLIGNTANANIQWKKNRNTGGSDWYSYAKNTYAHTIEVNTNNREWNRLTLEINKKTGAVTGYMNGKLFSYDPAADNALMNLPTDMDSLAFQTAGLVSNDGDLAILFDNISVYPGQAKLSESEGIRITDAEGNPIKTFKAGDTLYVNVKSTNNTDSKKDYVAVYGIYDAKGACVDVKFFEINDVLAGGTINVSGENLNFTVAEGAKEVKAFLWQTWDCLTPVCEEVTATVTE